MRQIIVSGVSVLIGLARLDGLPARRSACRPFRRRR